MTISVQNLRDDLSFGARIDGVTYDALTDDAVRKQIVDVFEDRGMIVFENIEASSKMHVTLSNVFGPLKDHPVPAVDRVDQDAMPGVIDLNYDGGGKATIVEIKGEQLANWLPWHFDHCYNNELNRAGVLRAVTIAPEGGLTMFADGVELYRGLPADLVAAIEGSNILYSLDLAFPKMRFGLLEGFRQVSEYDPDSPVLQFAKNLPRSVHPAVWKRETGEKVLHVSPWMSLGIENRENPEGDALLEAVCQAIVTNEKAVYRHQWEPNQMLIWDNWRMLHGVSGTPVGLARHMQRTTIKGDYGLGYFENGGEGHKILEMTV